jgi:hypothetical protein
VPGRKALVRGTGDAGKCRSSPLGDLWLPTPGLNFKSIPDFAWRADMSLMAHCSRATSELNNALVHTTVPYMRLGAFSTGASRARLQNVVVLPCTSSFSYTPLSLLDNEHKHRNVATLPNLALLLRHFLRLIKELRWCLTSSAATFDILFGSFSLYVHLVILVYCNSCHGYRAEGPLQLMKRSLVCRYHGKERRRRLSREQAASGYLCVSFDAGICSPPPFCQTQ